MCTGSFVFKIFVIDLRTTVWRKRYLPIYFSTVDSPPFWDRRRFDGVSAAERFFLLYTYPPNAERRKHAIFPLSQQVRVRARERYSARSLGRAYTLWPRCYGIATRTSAHAPRHPPSCTHVLVFAPRAPRTEQRTFPGVRKRGPLLFLRRVTSAPPP